MISGRILGVAEVERRFTIMAPERVRKQVRGAVHGLGYTLQRNVQSGSLAGGVLHRRSGRLARSVNTRFNDSADIFRAIVGSALVYGRAWELGFTVPARDIYPKNGEALFWPGAAHPVKHVHQPLRTEAARPWLRPEFEKMRPRIQRELTLAMRGL